eukprot:gene5005-110_t
MGTKKKSKGNECIKNKEGNILFNESDIKKRWQEYESELFDDNRDDTYDTITNGEEADMLESEITKALQCMKTSKSPGVDEINTEMLKALDAQVYIVGTIPGDMNDFIFLRIPKS